MKSTQQPERSEKSLSENNNSGKQIPEAIVRQAIAWRIRLESGQADENDVMACIQWRLASRQHERAWQRLEQMEAPLQRAAQHAPALAQSTLLKTDIDCERITRRQALRRGGSALLGIGGLGVIAQQQGLWQQLSADYHNRDGLSRHVLSDNSELWLNQHSAADVNFSASSRQLRLREGELHLKTAQHRHAIDITLPQIHLQTHDADFTLRQHGEDTLVHVNQGSMQVSHSGNGQNTVLGAGSAMQLSSKEMTPLDSKRFEYSAWIEGVIAVRNMPLKDLLDELSRYHKGVVRCDERLHDFMVSGVYRLNDTHTILNTLARSAKAELRYFSPWLASLSPKTLSA